MLNSPKPPDKPEKPLTREELRELMRLRKITADEYSKRLTKLFSLKNDK